MYYHPSLVTCVFCLMVSAVLGQSDELVGVVRDSQIYLRGSGQNVVAFDFVSESGSLVPLAAVESTPWELIIANSATNVAVGNLGPAVVIDGELGTGVGYVGEAPETDLTAIWGNETEELLPLDISLDAEPSFSGFVNPDGNIVLVGAGQLVAGVQFASDGGLLVPIPPGDLSADVAPFQVLLANSTTLITVGNLGDGVLIDGELTTQIGYVGSSPETELIAHWATERSTVQQPFVVTKPEEVCGGELLGDIDEDGRVAFTDFLIVAANFGSEGGYEQGDLNCSGIINFPDFLILSQQFGQQLETKAVPEPSGTLLLMVGVGSVLLARGRYVEKLLL